MYIRNGNILMENMNCPVGYFKYYSKGQSHKIFDIRFINKIWKKAPHIRPGEAV